MGSTEQRFETNKTFEGPAGNIYAELTILREQERLDAIKRGLIDDPSKPKALEDAQVFRGTCLEMCPMYEREQREFQNDVKRWEVNPTTGRIDKDLAIKAFHRPAAGNEQALPSDVRPPATLKQTLDYLVNKIVSNSEPLDKDTHGFVRDRTRSIRQDFTLQNERGALAIACHERIVRFHILSLHQMCGIDGFDAHQEMEQLRKTLQSLAEYYDDHRYSVVDHPYEAEFRAYHIMTRLRDPDVLRHVQTLPSHIRKDKLVRHALRLYKYAQRSNEEIGRFKPPNSEGSYNAYTRFFELVRASQTSYTMACLCETQFNDVRKGALKCMRKAFLAALKSPSVSELVTILGCDDEVEVEHQCEQYGIVVRPDEEGLRRAVLNKSSHFDESRPDVKQKFSKTLVECKRGSCSLGDVIDNNRVVDSSSVDKKTIHNGRVSQKHKQATEFNKPSKQQDVFKKPLPVFSQNSVQSFTEQPISVHSSNSLLPVQPFLTTNIIPPKTFEFKIPATQKLPLNPEQISETIVGQNQSNGKVEVSSSLANEKHSVQVDKTLRMAAKAKDTEQLVENLSEDLFVNLVRNQIHQVVCETYALHWRSTKDRRHAWGRVKAACMNVLARRQQEAERAAAEAQRQSDYETAFHELYLGRSGRKRARAERIHGESTTKDNIRRAQETAQKFWAPLDIDKTMIDIKFAKSEQPWKLLIVLSDTSSKQWFETKFGLTSNLRRITRKQDETKIEIEIVENGISVESLQGVGAFIFQCSGDIDSDRGRFLSLLQGIADESDRSFPVLLVRFDKINREQLHSELMISEILADRKSPVTYCGILSIESMLDSTKLEEQLQLMLSHTSTTISPLGLSRAAIREQQSRLTQPSNLPVTNTNRLPRIRSSFYDPEVMQIIPPQFDGNVRPHDAVPRQLSDLQDNVRRARELLAQSST